MKRLAAVAVVALALAGTASADVFRVVPSVSPASPAFLPSAEVPNTPGSISFTPELQQRAGLRRGAQLRPAARALAARRRALRRAVAGARGDQQDRVELRPQHGPELGRRDRLDAVHAVDLGALGRRRRRRRARQPVERRGRDRRGRALPRRLRRRDRHLAGRLLLQPRPVVRGRGAPARPALRQRRGGRDLQPRPAAGLARSEPQGRRAREPEGAEGRARPARAQPPRGRAAPTRGVGAPALRPACPRPARRAARRAGQRRARSCQLSCRASSPRHGRISPRRATARSRPRSPRPPAR